MRNASELVSSYLEELKKEEDRINRSYIEIFTKKDLTILDYRHCQKLKFGSELYNLTRDKILKSAPYQIGDHVLIKKYSHYSKPKPHFTHYSEIWKIKKIYIFSKKDSDYYFDYNLEHYSHWCDQFPKRITNRLVNFKDKEGKKREQYIKLDIKSKAYYQNRELDLNYRVNFLVSGKVMWEKSIGSYNKFKLVEDQLEIKDLTKKYLKK